jgi:hypothetical protein
LLLRLHLHTDLRRHPGHALLRIARRERREQREQRDFYAVAISAGTYRWWAASGTRLRSIDPGYQLSNMSTIETD